ncbi:MAG TPA: PD-(D/E)XK nuclease family protein [Thermoanaerobaculia bacterium]|jgi:ATP-dependent helicase/nuclease subunit B
MSSLVSSQFDLPFGTAAPSEPKGPGAARRERPRLVEALAAVCRESPLDEKVLVAPSRFVGHQIAEALARSGAAWVHLRIESVGSLAHGVVGPSLAHEGLTLLSRAQALALIEQACAEALPPSSYFGELSARPGLHRAIQSTFHELRAAGITPAALPEDAFGDPKKAADLKAVLERYETALAKGNFVDRAEVLRRAVSVLRATARPSHALYLLAASSELRAVETELVERLSAGCLRVLESDGPERWTENASRAPLFRALGEENEIREIFRRILAQGTPFDDAEMIASDPATYGPLVYELASEHGVPCTFGDGIAATFTRPGQAVLGYLRWLETDFESEELREILAAGLIDLSKVVASREPPGSLPAARELKEARIGWGRERSLLCLDAHVTELETELEFVRRRAEDADEDRSSRAEWIEKRLDTTRFVRSFVSRLLSTTPEPEEGKVELRDVARAASAFVGSFGRISGELDGVASKALRDLFAELETLPFPRLELRAAASRLAEAVGGLRVAADRPRPGHLHLADYRSGGYSGRSKTFLVGLDARRHPGTGLQDPVLLDLERRAINSALRPLELPMRASRPAENAVALRSCLARLRGDVTVSYASWDLLEAREQFPAAAFLEIYRIASRNAAADYSDLENALADRAGFLTEPERALNETEWWLAQTQSPLLRGGRAAGAVREAYPWLADGHEAVTQRESNRFTVYDGLVRDPAGLDPRTSGRPTSCSRIQDLARCPYSYFLKRVLRIQPPEDTRRDPTAWLDARETGLLLHEVFRRFYVEAEAGTGKPEFDRDWKRLEGIAGEEIERWRARVPPRSTAALEAIREDVRIACRNFLQDEAEHCRTVTPRWFEVAFGPSRERITPPGSPDPVRIALGGGTSFLLAGRIDRVDEVGEGEYQVWDYKTGSAWATSSPDRGRGGRRIQDVLYAQALEVLLERNGRKGRVVKSGYFYPGRRGEGERYEGNVDFEAARTTLENLFDLLAGGVFPHSKSEDDCTLCDFQNVCGGAKAAADRMANKLGIPGANTELDPYRRLNP